MFGRVPIFEVRSLDDVGAFLASSNLRKVLILDVDNKQYGQTVDTLAATLAAIKASGIPKPSYIVNSGGGLHEVRSPMVGVGDQVLTDGMLAWRLGATFLHLVIDAEKERRRQAAMRRVGKVVMRLFFRRTG